MPHKHKRKRDDDKGRDADLPPSMIAKPLRPGHNPPPPPKGPKRAKKPKLSKDPDQWANDTPRAFLQLMRLGRGEKRPKGPDNGDAPRKGKGKGKPQAPITPAPPKKEEEPIPELTIKHGEKLADFAARVDQAMPIAGLARKMKKGEGKDEHRTKHEKKLLRLQAQWRKDEAAYREKREEAEELAEEEEEEEEGLVFGGNAGGKKGRKGVDEEDDPWAVLEGKRDRPKGLHDVAKAPPQFKSVPREVLKVKGAKVMAADVPKLAGSLKRREELQGERAKVIEAYREMVRKQKQKGSS
ncbi:hypothetical protein P152DRAFT_505546 [Eremomyces bilateralis CBS 781.70]|uniref:Uncharacterized protein n=1 Tax=Eremomyces bilateralis CBS 781.70 TaxID=1392243 RepID=A0A6G1GCV1_9PEZI|nr:uncharacterized protein P152DRAFT_505546 [Eremomyces bilateralis CBS 781.70]KAF1815730.1 hypothetical protein P152DRAFT_505546 [Eremomyces bilateralis CBS 781.70]